MIRQLGNLLNPASSNQTDGEWSVCIGGDYTYTQAYSDDPVGEKIKRKIQKSDLSAVNLEAPVTEGTEPIDIPGPTKQADKDAPKVLRNAGFDAVTLANNHIMDHGAEGLRETIDTCQCEGIATFGAGEDVEAASEPLEKQIEENSVALFSFCEQQFGVSKGDKPGTAWIGHNSVEERIENAVKQYDVVIVIIHGGVEYVPLPSVQRQNRFRRIADMGVDLVVGHHPHVPQGWELYNGIPIFYSLGNFLFKHGRRSKTDWGYAIQVRFEHEEVQTVEIILTELVDGSVRRIDNLEQVTYIDHLQGLSDIVSDREQLQPYWQEIAVRLFFDQYTRSLSLIAGDLEAFCRNPKEYILNNHKWSAAYNQYKMKRLLNRIRNEAHRAIIQTALEVHTGEQVDKRTPEIIAETDNLLKWTDDQPSVIQRKIRDILMG